MLDKKKKIEEKLARSREHEHDEQTDDNSDVINLADSDGSDYALSESDKICEPAPLTEEQPQPAPSSSAEPATPLTVTLESLSLQTYLLREAFTKSPNNISTNYDMACTTLCMLEAYGHRNHPRRDYEQCFVLNISDNIEDARAAFETLRMPDTYIFSVVMKHLSKAFGELLNDLFDSTPGATPNLDNAASASRSKPMDSVVAKEADTGVSIIHHVHPPVKPGEMRSLRGGGSDSESDSGTEHSSFVDSFERLYDRLLQENAEVCGDAALLSCTEAWMKFANLLQMHHNYLGHQVRELRDINASLEEDVEWHVHANAKLEDELREARLGKAAVFADMLKLDAQMSHAQVCGAVHSSESIDDGSTYTDMTDSGSSGASMGNGTDTNANWTIVQDARTWPPIHEEPAPGALMNVFYFFPRTSLILLQSSPVRLYQFPRGYTLPQIHESLIRRYEQKLHNDPVFQIMHMLNRRECLDIQIPDSVRDEVIKISLPNLDAVPDTGNEGPLAAWEACDGIDGAVNVESWQAWHDIVQPRSSRTVGSAHSDLSFQEDAAELFTDWSWDLDAATEARLLEETSPFSRPRIHHTVPSDSNKTPCLRGGTGEELDALYPTIQAEDAPQRCIDRTGHMFPNRTACMSSAHWAQEYMSAGNAPIRVLEACRKYPGKRHVVTTQLPAGHGCVHCDLPDPRYYRPASADRFHAVDAYERLVSTAAHPWNPVLMRNLLGAECEHCLEEAEGAF